MPMTHEERALYELRKAAHWEGDMDLGRSVVDLLTAECILTAAFDKDSLPVPHEQKLLLGPDTAGGRLGRGILAILNRCVFDQPDSLDYKKAVEMIALAIRGQKGKPSDDTDAS